MSRLGNFIQSRLNDLRQNLTAVILAALFWLLVELLVGIQLAKHGEEAEFILLVWVGTIITTFIALFFGKWLGHVINGLILFGVFIFIFVTPLRERQEDWRHRFPEADENTINVLISDFDSTPSEVGKEFTNRLFEDLIAKLRSAKNTQIVDSSYNTRVEFKRTNQVWSETEMRKRGERRRADLGLIGTYERSTDGDSVIHNVKKLQCLVLDSLLTEVLESDTPVDSLYDWSVSSKSWDIPPNMVTNTSKLVHYIYSLSANLQLLKIAYRKENTEQRREILARVNQEFAKLYSLIGSVALAKFHEGNSYIRSVPFSTEHDKIDICQKAVVAYHESITAQKEDSSKKTIKYGPARPYFNLGYTYRMLYKFTTQTTWLDSADFSYKQAVNVDHSKASIEEYVGFLDQRLGIEERRRLFTSVEFRDFIDKYLKWNQALADCLLVDNDSTKVKLEETRKFWEKKKRSYKPRTSR